MKKSQVRVVKQSALAAGVEASTAVTAAGAAGSNGNHKAFSKTVAHKISSNVLSWVDELRERKTIETVQSFNLLAKAGS